MENIVCPPKKQVNSFWTYSRKDYRFRSLKKQKAKSRQFGKKYDKANIIWEKRERNEEGRGLRNGWANENKKDRKLNEKSNRRFKAILAIQILAKR